MPFGADLVAFARATARVSDISVKNIRGFMHTLALPLERGFPLSKRSQQLFNYLVAISNTVREAADLFAQGITDLASPAQLAAKMQELEYQGDDFTNGLANLLNASYVTPIDREDFLALAVRMDDIIDGLEACTVRFDLYRVTECTPVMTEFADNIVESASEILEAVNKLQSQELAGIREHTMRLSQLEKTGDSLLRNSLRTLFTDGADALSVIKLKEIYEILEGITDKCNQVGDTLDSVILKNA